MQTIKRVTFSAYGMHLADQIALVSVPLVAALVFDASPEIIGILVASQSMAHLFGSLPFGLIVDRTQASVIVRAATLISLIGFGGTAFAVISRDILLFGTMVAIGGFGIVLFVLAALSILPRIVAAEGLATANARIEIPRAISSFAIPLTVGLVITENIAPWIFVIAFLGALFAFGFAYRLPALPIIEQKPEGIVRRIIEGGRFVMKHNLLLPISLCAIFWNLAFSALLVVMVPLIVDVYFADPGTFGTALSAFGLAAICGTWLSGHFSKSIPPNVILLFGPASSVVAVLVLIVTPVSGSAVAIHASFFLLGFGPSMWLVAQNSVRQLVTPGYMLGRVNSLIQTAIYGVRPVGALIGGVIVGSASPGMGLIFVAIMYACSLAVSLFSRLMSVRTYSDLEEAGAV